MVTLWDSFSMVITYVWSRYFPDTVVSFLFGIRFKARFLPLALLAMDAVMGGGITGGLLGIGIGHLYYFLRDEWPGGADFVRAPALLYHRNGLLLSDVGIG